MMAKNFWENDPIVSSSDGANGNTEAEWWKGDPLVEDAAPSPGKRVRLLSGAVPSDAEGGRGSVNPPTNPADYVDPAAKGGRFKEVTLGDRVGGAVRQVADALGSAAVQKSEATAAVFGSPSPQAGAGRGRVNPALVDPSTLLPKQPKPYASRIEALDDAVNLLDEGADLNQVAKAFGGMGITQDEIAKHGQGRGSKFFEAPPDRSAPSQPLPPGASGSDSMQAWEPGVAQGAMNLGKRTVGRAGQAVTGTMYGAGMVSADSAARLTARDERKIQGAAPGEDVQRGMQEIGGAKSFGEAASAMVSNPGATATMLAESMLLSAPALATTAIGLPAKGMSAMVGSNSAALEFGGALSEVLSNRGVDLLDIEASTKALQDPAVLREIRERGAKRGLTIGVIDALTAGIAGKFLQPAMRAVEAGKLTGGAARQAVAAGWAKELGAQVAGGAGGEAIAGATVGEFKPADILMEGLGEMVSAPMEAQSNLAEASARDPMRQIANEIDSVSLRAPQGSGATTQTMQLDPWALAKSKGFHVEPPAPGMPPIAQRQKTIEVFKELGAYFGMPQKMVDAGIAATDGKPAQGVGTFLKKYVNALSQRGLANVSDPDLLEVLDAMAPQSVAAPGVESTPQGGIADMVGATGLADEMGADGARAAQQRIADIEASDATGLADEPAQAEQSAQDLQQVAPEVEQAGAGPAAPSPIDEAAQQAATSPLNDLAEPTQAQKEAGNYKLGHTRVAGMDIKIENPQGSQRKGVGTDGKPWAIDMQHHYGYVAGTLAADGDKLDVFVKPGLPEDWTGPAFVVDQVDPKTGAFDEHKTILGAKDEAEAEAIYRSNYAPDWQGLGAITRLPMPAFKAWAKSGHLKDPLGDISARRQRAASERIEPQSPVEPTPPQAAQAPMDHGGIAAPAGGRVDGAPGVAGASTQADGVTAGSAPVDRFPNIATVKGVNVGIGGLIKPKPVASGLHTYRETGVDGLDSLMREDRMVVPFNGFVSDNPDLAIGQGIYNHGVHVVFRPDSVSGKEHSKPATGDQSGREYKTDMLAPQAVQTITMPSKDAGKLRGLTKMRLKEQFDREEIPGDRVRFHRKGLDRLSPPDPVGYEPPKSKEPKATKSENGSAAGLRPDGTLFVKGDSTELKRSLTDAGIPSRSIIKSDAGVLVGKTQAAKAQEILDPAPPALPATVQADVVAQQDGAEQSDPEGGRPASEAPAGKPLDHGELNIPGRTRNLDAEIDKQKAAIAAKKKADARESSQQNKADKAAAKELHAQIGDAMVEKMAPSISRRQGLSDKEAVKQISDTIDQMVKWEPAKFIAMAKKFQEESANGSAKASAAESGADSTGPRTIGRIGKTPNSAHDVELKANKDGTLTPWSEGYEMLDFNSGDPIKVQPDATDAAVLDAIKQAGALGKGVKFYPVRKIDLSDNPSYSVDGDGGVSGAGGAASLASLGIVPIGGAVEGGVSGSIPGNLEIPFALDERSISKVDLQRIALDLQNGWRGITGGQIIAVDTWRDLPEKIVQNALAKRLRPTNVEGVEFQGNVYLVRSALKSREQAERVIFHEVYGHLGLKGALGGSPTATLNALWNNMNGLAGVAKLAKKYEAQPGKTVWDRLQPYIEQTDGKSPEERRSTIMNELIAFLAQGKDTSTLTQFKGYLSDLKAAVVALLRKFNLTTLAAKLDRAGTELDVLALVRDAREAIISGKTAKGEPFQFVSGGKAFGQAQAQAFSKQDGGQFSIRNDAPVSLPDAMIAHPLAAATEHPDYAAAKAGDVVAAFRLASDLMTPAMIQGVRSRFGSDVIVQPVVSEESTGRNKIPRAVAEVLAHHLGTEAGSGIVQSSRAYRTSLDGFDRLFAQPEFTGPVERAKPYLLIDDTLTQGGTFAAMASHIQQNGGSVAGAVALTGKQYSAKLTPSHDLLSQVREKFADVEPSFRAATGRGFDSLTESEARYLAKHKSPDDVRDRITAAGRLAGQDNAQGADQGSTEGLSQGDTGAQFSALPDEGENKAWILPEGSKTDSLIYELQDGRIDLKRVQEAILSTGKKIEQAFDARLQETLFPGRMAIRSSRFLEVEVKPLLDRMARNNVTMNELSDFLHARGAKERNAQIAKVNPDLQDGGAGTNTQGMLMTNENAQAHLDAIRPVRRDLLSMLAKNVDALTAGTRKLLIDEGLESQDVISAWEKAYPNYIPMFRDEAEAGSPHPIGTGMSVRGSASKRATGSTKEVTNILAHVLMQREAAITRAEKNRVAVSLYGLALTNPNKKFWATIKPGMSESQINAELKAMGVDPDVAAAGMERAPTIRTVDEASGRVVSRQNPLYKSLQGAIVARVNGEDRVLLLNEKDERALRMALNLKNMDGLTKIDLAGSIVGQATRWMASVNTAYNPAFGIVNVTRDVLGAAVNLSSTPLRGKSTRVLIDTLPALKGIGKELAGLDSGEWGKLYLQFQEDGGQTGYRDMFADANARTKELEAALKALEKRSALNPRAAGMKVLDALEGFNTTLENGVRVAAYKAALDRGMSRSEAARLARELTVDFNRKGRMTRELGPLFAFFNASIQGSARTVQTLRGPAGRRILLGGLTLGVLQAIALAAAGYDDDEIPEFIKARAFIIPLGLDDKKQKRFAAIPLPLGLHVLPNTGRVLTEMLMSRGYRAGEKAFSAVGEIAGAFNPLGGGNIFTIDGALKTVAPTVVDPLIELAVNKNFAGVPIERHDFDRTNTKPGHLLAREKTLQTLSGQTYTEISRLINKATGGDDFEAGLASPSPEKVRYLAQVVGGGLLREMEKVVNVASSKEPTEASDLPLLGRFYNKVEDERLQESRYYRNVDAIEAAESIRKRAENAKDEGKLKQVQADRPEVGLHEKTLDAKRYLKNIDELPFSQKEKDAQRLQVMKDLNGMVKERETSKGR